MATTKKVTGKDEVKVEKPAAAKKVVVRKAGSKAATTAAVQEVASPVEKTTAKPVAKKIKAPSGVAKGTVASPRGQDAIGTTSAAARPGRKSALNPITAWPFPTGSRPK